MSAGSDQVLVTGGTGFLGGWAIVQLLQRGYRVRTTVRTAAREQPVRAAVATEVDPGDCLEFGLEVVDVRDVVALHLDAMTAPEAAGERFLGTGDFMWMLDIAEALRHTFGHEAERVPTLELPEAAVREAARTDPGLREILPALGRRSVHSTGKARRVLGWQPRPATETVVDAARSILRRQPA